MNMGLHGLLNEHQKRQLLGSKTLKFASNKILLLDVA
jgi:hypothetical protein